MRQEPIQYFLHLRWDRMGWYNKAGQQKRMKLNENVLGVVRSSRYAQEKVVEIPVGFHQAPSDEQVAAGVEEKEILRFEEEAANF